MHGGSVTMDGSTIANCSGTLRQRCTLPVWLGIGPVFGVGGCGGWLVLLGGVKGEVCVCVCVCATWESIVWFRICVC